MDIDAGFLSVVFLFATTSMFFSFYYLCVFLFSHKRRKLKLAFVWGAVLLLSVFLSYYLAVNFHEHHELNCCCMGCQ